MPAVRLGSMQHYTQINFSIVPGLIMPSMVSSKYDRPVAPQRGHIAFRRGGRGGRPTEACPDFASVRPRLCAVEPVWKDLSRGIAPAVARRHRPLRDLACFRAL